MDLTELCELVGDAIAEGTFPSGRIEAAWTDSASVWVETADGERFRLDVTLEGKVGEP
jgi:hypothetical protein